MPVINGVPTSNEERPKPDWDVFPSLGLPNEQRGRVSMWAGDEANLQGGSSASITWQPGGMIDITLYAGRSPVDWIRLQTQSLLEVKLICLDHFNKHPLKGETSGGNKT